MAGRLPRGRMTTPLPRSGWRWPVAKRLIAAMSALGIEHPGAPGRIVTVSVGVASADGRDPAALLRGADRALYAAKRAGRACAKVAPAGLAPSAPTHDGARRGQLIDGRDQLLLGDGLDEMPIEARL